MLGLFGSNHSEDERALLRFIHTHFGFKPKKLRLFQQSLRHKSAATEIKDGIKDSNERLEFLGDSILDAVVADYLYSRYPYKDEGFLTKLRARLVSRTHLNLLATKMDLDSLLEMNLHESVKHKSLNGNAFEALVGAIYLEKGYRFTRKALVKGVLNKLVDLQSLEKTESNFKSKLLEWAQKNRSKVSYEILQEEDFGYQKNYVVQVRIGGKIKGKGKGTSKKEAEQAASGEAWKIIQEEP